METLSVTFKVLLALLVEIPIVTPKYWNDLKESILTEKKIISNCKDYVPSISEPILRDKIEDFYVNPARKELFKNIKFYFLLKRDMNLYKQIIILAGMFLKTFSKI